MRTRRCYTPQTLSADALISLDQAAHHHLITVLRLRAGDRLVLFNGDGYDYHGELAQLSKKSSQVQLNQKWLPGTEAKRKITLVQAIAKGERMDWIVQKATELGVACIQPVLSERSMVKLNTSRADKK